MTSRIFAESAPAYWERRLSAIPAEPKSKRTSIPKWTGYSDNLPSPANRTQWLETYPDHGIALCLGNNIGNDSVLVALDVDDDRYAPLARAVLGGCPSAKRGRKGETLFAYAKRSSKLKSTKIMDAEGNGIIDVLASGRMTIMPPSTHPETGRPYVFIGKSLLETDFSELPELEQAKLDVLTLIIKGEHAPTLLSGHSTHEAGLRLAAQLVSFGCTDQQVHDFITALLPSNYSGNTKDEISEWLESARKKGFDRPRGARKKSRANTAEQVVQLFDATGARLFRDLGNRSFMTVPTLACGWRTFAVRSYEGQLWLTGLYYDAADKAISSRTIDDVLNTLSARATFRSPQYQTFLRVGGNERCVVIDLGQDDGRVVIIDASGWRIVLQDEFKLIRSAGFQALPDPIQGGALEALKELLQLDADNWLLVLAFMLNCLRPTGPYMPLLVEGEQGSGKSSLCMFIKRIIDPNQVEKARLPESERDLMIHAKDYFLLSFDNVSGMKGDLSDALCVLATGGGYATRKLYSNDELYVFNSTRPVIINGIADFATRPDLLERSIPLRLPTIDPDNRKTEAEMLRAFEAMLPGILGALYTIVSGGIRDQDRTAAPRGIRMADCARWFAACEPHANIDTGAFVRVLISAQEAIAIDRVHQDSLFGALNKVIEKQPFEGTILALFLRLGFAFDRHSDKYFPASASHLSRQLRRLRPAMEKTGLHVSFRARSSQGQIVRVWRDGQDDQEAAAPDDYGTGY